MSPLRIARRMVVLVAGVLAAFLLATPALAQQLRVAVTSAAENAPFFAAMERGTFSKLGLDQFSALSVRQVELLAAHAAVAIENARLLAKERRVAATAESQGTELREGKSGKRRL